MHENEILTSGKMIGEYLGRSARTVERMMKKYPSFPVRKLRPGGLSATKTGLDDWYRQKTTRKS